jgi:hypothetical protein
MEISESPVFLGDQANRGDLDRRECLILILLKLEGLEQSDLRAMTVSRP